jgi:DNA-binding CsgD family transcriptional regulator
VAELIPELIDPTRLLVDLQQVSDIVQGLANLSTPEAIAQRVTDSLIEKFDFAFSRIWLVEADQLSLRLVASSGLYTRIDGSFARVPMGAFKVGKIAKNRIPFLSNNLPEEPWVKDREWAIANRIKGFAGYPLISGDSAEPRVIGVLATFSYRPLTPEFLEALRFLCSVVTLALEAALHNTPTISPLVTLSEQLAQILPSLTLVGTERPIMLSSQCIFLQIAEILEAFDCHYCRLTYGEDAASFVAILTAAQIPVVQISDRLNSRLCQVQSAAMSLGGSLQTQFNPDHATMQILLTLPYAQRSADKSLLSDRELAIFRLLGEGLRDRDIAQKLMISESTVKFHINNSMAKLKAKTRYQALYLAVTQGWLG